ncbi:MAG: SLC13 family permease [Actinomycetota bacterium]
MNLDAWITLIVAVATLVALASDRFSPALVMAGAVTALLVVGVIDQEGALAGFSNDAPITVAALYILAGAVKITGALEQITERVLGSNGQEGHGESRRTLARILYPSMSASAFIANTPLVAMIAPRVLTWARRTGRSASRYLMPLSYAIIFGGCITLIGTSTNLVVSGLLRQFGYPPLGLFEITGVGLPIALVGVTAIVLLAPRLLKVRHSPDESIGEQVRRFTVEMEVGHGSSLVGQTVAGAGLRQLEGVFLVEIERDGRTISPVTPRELLGAGDRLTFSGNVSRILDLQAIPGLVSAEHRHFEVVGQNPGRAFYEVVIGESSPLVGSTLKESGFRARYGAAVVAIHRAGEAVAGKLGEIRLRAGDLLLVLGSPDFRRTWREKQDFLVVVPLAEGRPLRREKARIVEILTLGLILVAGTGLLDLLQTSLLIAIALVGFKIITVSEARASVDLEVIVLMATSFGLGIAINESGLASEVAGLVVDVFQPLGDLGVLAGILIATMLMTELLSNNAAAVLMFPIALAAAEQASLNPRPFAIVILFGATLSFLTPIGYQTNTLVWSMGGYKYGDFARLGAPLTLLTIVMILVMVPLLFPLR